MPPDEGAVRSSWLWRAFLRLVIALLAALLALLLLLALDPGALALALTLLPGHVAIPSLGPLPPEPRIDAPRGELPGGYVAFTGVVAGMPTACNFLLELDDGQRLGVGTAHAVKVMPADASVVFRVADGAAAARMGRRIAFGEEFLGEQLDMDYALWLVRSVADGIPLLRPDPRGQAQPGERVVLYGRAVDAAGESLRRAGTVMSVQMGVTWVQMEEGFDPSGYSGCPVVSAYTGQVVGMAAAGSRTAPVILGLHPVGSLVEKAQAALLGE
jgi:hypothetical protein